MPNPYTDETMPWDLLASQGELNLPRPYTGYEYPPTFSNFKDAVGKMNILSNRVFNMLPGYYQKVAAPLSTNTMGGLNYDIFPWTNPEMHKRFGGGPGSFYLEAHGDPHGGVTSGMMNDPGIRERQIFSEIYQELATHMDYIRQSRKLGDKDRKKLMAMAQSVNDMIPTTEWGVLPVKDIVKSLGSKANEIRQVINGACYAAGVSPQEWKQMFPALTNIVQADLSMPTTVGAVMNAFEPRPSYLPPYTNAPGTSPLYNYALDASGNPYHTNIVSQPSDWNPTK